MNNHYRRTASWRYSKIDLGRIWIGTFGGGVTVFDPESATIRRYPESIDSKSNLAGARATTIAEDRFGNIWIGTDGAGLFELNPARGSLHQYRHDPANASSLGSNTIYSIHVDADNYVWLGMAGGGLSRVNRDNNQLSNVSFQHFGRRYGINDVVYGVQPDDAGALWLSTNRGLTTFDPRTEETQTFYKSHGMQDEEFNFGAHHRTGDGRLLFGGPRGYNDFLPRRINASSRALPVVPDTPRRSDKPLQAIGTVPKFNRLSLV